MLVWYNNLIDWVILTHGRIPTESSAGVRPPIYRFLHIVPPTPVGRGILLSTIAVTEQSLMMNQARSINYTPRYFGTYAIKKSIKISQL